jgi:peptide-methionine (S)-S-oxide reductase
VKGVEEVVSGYAGGNKPNPTYKEVAAGETEYAEAVRVRYNPEEITYKQLVKVFYGSHDPTQLNRQGPDIGKQYRSAIFYQNQEELQIAREIKEQLEASGKYEEGAIVTKFTEYDKFWPAEDYHQGYYDANPNDSYIVNVSKPKVEKFMKEFNDLLKEEYK